MGGFDERRFETTRWSLVLAAGDDAKPEAREAFETLCRIYWPPIYAYLRARGWNPADAQDGAQSFFLKLIEKRAIAKATPERGRFRTFLLTTLKNQIADNHDREFAQKRGGGTRTLSLDATDAEMWLAQALTHEESPEQLFDRRWAETLIQRTHARLEELMSTAGGRERFAVLRPFLAGDADALYGDAARALGIGESAVRVAVHRMRRRFGELLREEISHTTTSPSDVDDELRHLQRILAR